MCTLCKHEHITTVTYIILKSAVYACTFNIVFVSMLDNSSATLSLLAVLCILYIFLKMFWCHHGAIDRNIFCNFAYFNFLKFIFPF